MSQLKQVFESLRLQEAKAQIAILGAGIGQYEMGFASYDSKRRLAILRIRRCEFFDFETWDFLDDKLYQGPFDLDWAKKAIKRLPKFYGGEVIHGSNDTYESGYVLFTEDRPNQKIETFLTHEEWVDFCNSDTLTLWPSGLQTSHARIAKVICDFPSTSGWHAPMVDQ